MNVQIEESWKAHLEPEFEKELAKSGEVYSFEWDFDYTLAPVYNRNDFFCYGVSSSEYTGGAHGMYSNRYYTIDLSNWKRIGLDDIFQPDSSDALSSIKPADETTECIVTRLPTGIRLFRHGRYHGYRKLLSDRYRYLLGI